jgi:adenylate kinase family enzyme
MQRIMIIGGPGSGKSTLARDLGARLGLPVIHFDPMFWAPCWVQRSRTETLALISAAALQDAWVMDGNHSETYDLRADRADLIIFLDLPRRLRVWRILKRRVRYNGQTRPDMPANCPERLDLEFLMFVWRWDQTSRPKALALLDQRQGRTRTVRLTGPAQVRQFLADPTAK